MPWTKEERREYDKKYRVKYREKNKEKIKEYRQTPQGQKSQKISRWKNQGIIAEDYDEWYEKYINCNECNFCHKEFENSFERCLDHHHGINDRENVRGILCRGCNNRDALSGLLI